MPRGKAFPPEFRSEAVRIYKMTGWSLRETAAEIGVSVNAQGRWVRQAEIDEGKTNGLTSDERQELRVLRKENRLLKEEKEILRMAALFFARGTKFRMIDEEIAHHPVSRIARAVGVMAAGYYAWRNRTPSARVEDYISEKLNRISTIGDEETLSIDFDEFIVSLSRNDAYQ